jgi:beta-glucosidase-like glycosyl hydrolase
VTFDKLRSVVGFTGAILSDDMEMGAITSSTPAPEAAVEYLLAGGDMVMIAHDLEVADATYDAIRNAVLSGRLPRSRLDEAVATLQALPEACGEITHYADGNAGPVLCADGRANLAADRWFRSLKPQLAVLDLAPSASLAEVERAMCTDKTVSHMTNPIESSAYELRAAEAGWAYGNAPELWLVSQRC